MQDPSSFNSSSALQIDPKVFLAYVLRYWYLVLIGVLGGLLYGYYQVRYTPATYSTNSRMLVKDEYSSWGQEYFLPGMELVSSRNRLVNEIGIMKSFPLMERVAQSLDWRVSYYKIGNIKVTEQYPSSEFNVKALRGSLSAYYFLLFKIANSFYLAKVRDSLEYSTLYQVGQPIDLDPNKILIEQVSANISTE